MNTKELMQEVRNLSIGEYLEFINEFDSYRKQVGNAAVTGVDSKIVNLNSNKENVISSDKKISWELLEDDYSEAYLEVMELVCPL